MNAKQWFEDKDWTLLEFHGKDRKDFLHRLTTNELPTSSTPLIHNFFLSVNAKIQAELWVSSQDDHLALFTPTDHVPKLRECIEQYHFGEKIEIIEPEGQLFVLKVEENTGLAEISEHCKVFSPDPRYGEDCCWCFVPEKSLTLWRKSLLNSSSEMPEVERENRRISHGRPQFRVDYDENTLFVEMAQTDDFSESKGCYPGQEIVARVLHRGRLNKHLRAFHSKEKINSNWVSEVEGKEIASVRSTVTLEDGSSHGYLLVRRKYDDEVTTLTGRDVTTLTVASRVGEVLTGDEE